MMKIIHTSDWHLGLRFCGYDPKNEYQLFFEQLTKTVSREKPDALLIAGDVFDIPIPANDLLKQFEHCLTNLHEACKTMLIIITSGNHDDSQWLEKQAKRWSEWGVHIIGQTHKQGNSYDIGRHIITVKNADGTPKGYIIGMPYMTSNSCPITSEQIPIEQRLPTFMKVLANRVEMINMENVPVIMMAHCFVLRDRLPGVERQKATLVLEDLPLENFDYLALGHTHSSKNVGSTQVRCCGSPWPITPKDYQRRSFSVVTLSERKGEIKVSERWVKNQCPLILVPKKPAKVDTVLRQLEAFPEDQSAFINLNVRSEDSQLEKEFIKRCKEICTGKKARLCSVVWAHGENLRFSNIADTNYLSYGQSLSNKKLTELPELVTEVQKSLNAQLTQLDKAINELHRQEDLFNNSVNKLRMQLKNLTERKKLRQKEARIKEEASYIQYLMAEPQYLWEEQFIELYKELRQNTINIKNNKETEIKALNERKKVLLEKAKALQRGLLYVEFDLNRHKKKIENLQKQKPQKDTSASIPPSVQAILDEHQQKEHELTQILQAGRMRIQSIENLFGSSIPKVKGIGNKVDDLLEQLDTLQQEVLSVTSTLGQIKQEMGEGETSIERFVKQADLQIGLWTTDLWKDQQFIETLIREHRLFESKKILFDRALDNIKKQIDAMEVDDNLENSNIEPQQLLAFLEPWMAELDDRFKAQHSELERQQTQIRHRVNDINLIQNKLKDTEEENEEVN